VKTFLNILPINLQLNPHHLCFSSVSVNPLPSAIIRLYPHQSKLRKLYYCSLDPQVNAQGNLSAIPRSQGHAGEYHQERLIQATEMVGPDT